MKHNLGNADRIVRMLFAAVIAVLYYINIITGTLAYVLLAAAGILILTSLFGFCPLYHLFGIHTNGAKKEAQ